MLDDLQLIRKQDRDGMLAILNRFDKQLEEALEIGLGTFSVEIIPPVENILVCGLGGSASGGDFLQAYLGNSLKIPFLVNRGYSIPGFAGPSTLVFVCSYSGNTEEIISAFQESREAGCQVICSTSGGQLKELARQNECPCIQLPEGYPPRTALGYSSIPLLGVLSRLGVISDRSEEVRRAIPWVRSCIDRYGEHTPSQDNPAKNLALQAYRKIPIFYGSQSRLEMVAVRWRTQFSENAKQLAYSGVLSEMNHNEIAGWRHPAAHFQHLLPVFLRDCDDHPRIQLRAEITAKMLKKESGACFECWSEGESWLQRLLALMLLGDYASIYLAFLNQEDPTAVEVIDSLKLRLKDHISS